MDNLETVLKYVIGIYYRPFLMHYEARHSESYGRAGAMERPWLRVKILTGPWEKANDLAFEQGASWRGGRAKRGIKKQLIDFQNSLLNFI